MSQEIFRRLLNQYISGELPSGEKARLNEMINDGANQDTLESVVREIMLSDAYGEIDNPALKARIDAWLDIHLRNEEQNEKKEDETKLVFFNRRRSWPRVAAAAIIVLLASGSYFLFLSRSQRQIALTQQQRFKNDVAPGGNAAVLTLADGRKIMLDSMTKG